MCVCVCVVCVCVCITVVTPFSKPVLIFKPWISSAIATHLSGTRDTASLILAMLWAWYCPSEEDGERGGREGERERGWVTYNVTHVSCATTNLVGTV